MSMMHAADDEHEDRTQQDALLPNLSVRLKEISIPRRAIDAGDSSSGALIY